MLLTKYLSMSNIYPSYVVYKKTSNGFPLSSYKMPSDRSQTPCRNKHVLLRGCSVNHVAWLALAPARGLASPPPQPTAPAPLPVPPTAPALSFPPFKLVPRSHLYQSFSPTQLYSMKNTYFSFCIVLSLSVKCSWSVMFRQVKRWWERGIMQASSVYSDCSFKQRQGMAVCLRKVKCYRLCHKVWMWT